MAGKGMKAVVDRMSRGFDDSLAFLYLGSWVQTCLPKAFSAWITARVGIKKEGFHPLLEPLKPADASGLVLRRLISGVDLHKFSPHRWAAAGPGPAPP